MPGLFTLQTYIVSFESLVLQVCQNDVYYLSIKPVWPTISEKNLIVICYSQSAWFSWSFQTIGKYSQTLLLNFKKHKIINTIIQSNSVLMVTVLLFLLKNIKYCHHCVDLVACSPAICSKSETQFVTTSLGSFFDLFNAKELLQNVFDIPSCSISLFSLIKIIVCFT